MMPFTDQTFPRAAAIAAVLALIGPAAVRAEAISVVGGDDGIDVFRAVSMAFAAKSDSVRVYVPGGLGAGGVVSSVAMGREMFGRLSRALDPDEEARGLIAQPIFSLPVAVITAPEAPPIQLTLAELEAILAGRIRDWSELGGAKQRIRIVMREDLKFQLGEQNQGAFSGVARREFSDFDVAEIARLTPGVIGLVPYRRPLQASHRLIPVGGLLPDAPGYGVRIGVRLVYRPEMLTPAGHSFLRFASGEEARLIVQRFGAEPHRQ